MAEYIPPNKNNIPFSFDTGGYQPPDFGNIAANFEIKEIHQQMASIAAAIVAMPQHSSPLPASIGTHLPQDIQALIGTHPPQNVRAAIKGWIEAVEYDLSATIRGTRLYQQDTYTFLKYCEEYIVGYSQHGVQIIKGKCHYGGIRDIGANIGTHYPGDLPAWVAGMLTADLSAEIIGDLPTLDVDLSAYIGTHPPEDLSAYIDLHAPENITAYIRGFDYRDLSASTYILQSQNLPAVIGAHLPEDLGGYIKPWPEEDLPGFIYGWDTKDLSANVSLRYPFPLPAEIGGHRPEHMRALIKGWVREAEYNLGASIRGFAEPVDLPAYIKATSKSELPAYLNPVPPRNLSAFIHGWQEADLGAEIDAKDYPWNLPASIVISGGFRGLTAEVVGKEFTVQPRNLSAYILVTQGVSNLSASMTIKQANDLGAFIDPGRDLGNLTAEIYPKILLLTGVLSVITMEHSDMSATISIPCFYSNLKDLSAYIRPVFQSNLGASIHPTGYVGATSNLGASFGYALDTVVQDKLTVNIHIDPLGFRTEDKYNINISLSRSGAGLGASITGTFRPADLPAYINVLDIVPYDFETWKSKERVYDTTYTQVMKDYEDVDISFQSIVKDYFYSSGSDVVAKVDRYTHFVTKVASHYSPTTARRLDKTLHKVKYLYDMRYFEDVDEAMRYAIWYVTTTPKIDLGAYINSIAPLGNQDLSARIGAKRHFSTNNNLTSDIIGKATYDYDVILGYTNNGVGFLSF